MSGYEWMDHAACAGADPERWFPDRPDSAEAEAAITVCAGCPVAGPCLEYALRETLNWGIFAGTTREDRIRLRAERGLPTRYGPRWLAPHGTPAAYRRHMRAHESPCDPCSRAEQVRAEPYNAARRAAAHAAGREARTG